MANFKIESTLVNRDAIMSTIWSTVQQLVVASSTYFILQAIQSATKGDMALGLRYIAAFVASLILVYLPNTISMVYLQRWRLASIDAFINAFATYNFGKPTLGHSRNKVHAESWLTNECFTVYDQATNLLYQLYSTFMNSALNILVIAAALDVRILFWYALAGAVLVGSNSLFKNKLTSASTDVQNSRKKLSNVMLTAWDNIFIGNRHNFSNWHSNYEGCLNDARTSASRYDLVRSVISSGAVAVALLIVALGNGIFLYENSSHLTSVAALFITLPRQLQIIQSIFAFFNLSLSLTGTKAQLKELQSTVEFGKAEQSPIQYVQFDAIEISSSRSINRGENFNQVKDLFTKETLGRFTVRGRNGAGKSTLLNLLKENLGDRAFFLPTNYSDLIFQSAFLNHSDGNRLLSVFTDITSLDGIDYVILDEWDSNLDTHNISSISAAIDTLAKTKVVIESRHRA